MPPDQFNMRLFPCRAALEVMEDEPELGAKALTGLHDEAVWVFLWQLDELFGVTRKVKGFKMRPDNVLWMRDAYVEA